MAFWEAGVMEAGPANEAAGALGNGVGDEGFESGED